MINFYAKTRWKKEYLYSAIETELKEHNIKFSLFDDRLQWNIYSAYGEGFIQIGSNPEEGYSYLDMFGLDFVVLECVSTPNLFHTNKIYWMILRLGETSGVNYPQLQEYENTLIWDSDSCSKSEIVNIVQRLCKEANDYYYNREQEYRSQCFQEQDWEDYGGMDNRTDEERDFDSMMDDNDAWSNIQ